MRKLLLGALALLFFAVGTLEAQERVEFKERNGSKEWLKIENPNSISHEVMILLLKDHLGLGENDELVLASERKDKYGYSKYLYQQYHNGIKVKGGQTALYYAPDQSVKSQGRLVYDLDVAPTYSLTEEEALNEALEFMGADKYMWESPSAEASLKELKNDENASYFPKGELYLFDKSRSHEGANYSVHWKFDIYAIGGKQRQLVYVNANNGNITHSLTGIHTDVANGTAETKYHGTKDIITDSTGTSGADFRLKDETRGNGGIETLDALNGTDYTEAVFFTDEDNYWDETTNGDDVAGDVHWAAEMTYDYFLEVHDRNSWNDAGIVIRSLVHYDENYYNASWNGSTLNFGDAGGNPYASIDVVAHEFGHAVTQGSGGLDYEYESGALNESYSDIFGNSVEHYAYNEEFSWKVGILNFQFRDMSNPNSHGDPDTYGGSNWYTGDGDNGGVHTNSGVQNYWFYLLSVGGSGENDHGVEYDLEGIGIIDAAKVAYQTLQNIGGIEEVQYINAFQGSIDAAEALFGECSPEAREVIKAWRAVGVGNVNTDYFFNAEVDVVYPESGCNLSSDEDLEVIFIYNEKFGCEQVLTEGDTVQLGYRDNGVVGQLSYEILDSDMDVIDELYYEDGIDLSEPGEHFIEIIMVINSDTITFDGESASRSILHTAEVSQDEPVGFESLEFSPDSFYVKVGENAEAKISSTADNTGTKGFRMTGKDVNEDLIDWPTNEEDNFTTNPEYISELCFCVDAENWDEVNLVFDMKQLHSEYWNVQFGEDMNEFSSSMRILVDGEQIGEQYHPTTYDNDPYLTHFVDLNEYAGSYFSLCFQSKNFISNAEDPVPGSTGDNTYLDNIRFRDPTVGIEELEDSDFTIFPNPTQGRLEVHVKDYDKDFHIYVLDAMGREVLQLNSNNSRNNQFVIDLSNQSKGLYIVKIQGENNVITKPIVLQ